MTLTGCATVDSRLNSAAIEQGRAQARVQLPETPDYCREQIAHAALSKTEDVRLILKNERRRLDKANDRIVTCAQYNDVLRKNLQGTE